MRVAAEMNSTFSSHFSFTKSKTKIAQTPTVMGNWAACASCNEPPRGRARERKNMATAVAIPRISLLFQVIVVFPRVLVSHSSATEIFVEQQRTFYAGTELQCDIGTGSCGSIRFSLADIALPATGAKVREQPLNNKVTTVRHPERDRRVQPCVRVWCGFRV